MGGGACVKEYSPMVTNSPETLPPHKAAAALQYIFPHTYILKTSRDRDDLVQLQTSKMQHPEMLIFPLIVLSLQCKNLWKKTSAKQSSKLFVKLSLYTPDFVLVP